VIDLEYFPRRSDRGNSIRVKLDVMSYFLVIKSLQLFRIRFCMRFSAMRFSTKVLEHAKITRWRHCNANSLKTLNANYMHIRLLCVYRMTKYIGKILF